MLKILIDTSVLLQNPALKSGEFETLRELAQAQLIQIYLPKLVKREFVSRLEDDFAVAAGKSLAALKALSRLPHEEPTVELITKLTESLASRLNKYEDIPRLEYENFVKTANVVEVPILFDSTDAVFDAYFSGGPPFEKRKSRKDIPDAFIYQTVLGQSAGEKEFHVVVADDNLAGHCSTIENVVVHRSLYDLVASVKLRELIDSKERFVKTVHKILGLLPALISSQSKMLTRSVEFHAPGALVRPMIGHGYSHEPTVGAVLSVGTIEIPTDRLAYMGAGRFRAEVGIYFRAEVDYELLTWSDDIAKFGSEGYHTIGETPDGVVLARKAFDLRTSVPYYLQIDYEFIRTTVPDAVTLESLSMKADKPGIGPIVAEVLGEEEESR